MISGNGSVAPCAGRLVAAVAGMWFSGAVLVAPALAGDVQVPFVLDNTIRGADGESFWVADEFVVEFKRPAARQLQVTAEAGAIRVNLPDLQQVIDEQGLVGFARQFPTAKPRAEDSKYPDLTGYYKVQIGAGADLQRVMEAFERHPDVDHVEPIGVHVMTATPNDTWYQNPPASFPYPQWHYWDTHGIDADLAWDSETGDPGVVVAIADSGVRYFHVDLGGPNATWGPANPQTNGNIFVNAGEIPGNGLDDDGNGFVDDTVGYDFVSSTSAAGCSCLDVDCGTADNDPDDGNGHGTHVAGTVGAITNNARVVAGVAGGFSDGTTSGAGNGVKIMPLRIGWHARCQGVTTGVVRMDYAAAAFNYVADMVEAGVNVAALNASWGTSNSGGLGAATDNLVAHDVLITYAAGNSNSTSTGYFGTRSDVLTVAATDQAGNGASFTNHGSTVDIAAPGVEIVSTYRDPADPDPNNHYLAVLDGTSMSAPHCAGVAALLESCNAALSRANKFSLMVSNTTAYSDSRDLGSGILNAALALDAAGCGAPQCQNNGDCDDGNGCTTDTCSGGVCSNTPINCDDGNACTSDSCSGGVCSNNPISCDDADPCTSDSCDPGSGCSNVDPACGPSDGCCPPGCDGASDPDCPSTSCGNGLCEAGEDCQSCLSDCPGLQTGRPANRYCCGNGVLEGPEGDGTICDGNP